MTITIELTDEQEAYVTAIARQRGMAVHDVVAQMIDAHIGPDNQTIRSGADQVDHRSAPFSAADSAQLRLHTLLHDLFAQSDALERQSGGPSTGASESPVAEAVRDKYRAQGLRV